MHRYGVFPDVSIPELGTEAIRNALKDANVEWDDIEEAYCGTKSPSMFVGHQICNQMGFTGLGITNVENASASGSTAFRSAYLAVASGSCNIAIALGVDKTMMVPNPGSQQKKGNKKKQSSGSSGNMPVHFFAAIAQQHMEEYGTTRDQLAQVSVKSHYNASHNPYAHFQKAVTMAEVHEARMVADPLTVLHCCPWDEGGAAVIICAKDIAKKYTDKVCPTVVASVHKSTLPDGDPLFNLTQYSARLAYQAAGVDPTDLDLVELHDAFTIEEIIYSEALGLCERGEGGRLAEDGTTSLTGKHPINSTGGLISMGHPIGPTGVGQVAEILWQMREECGKRQIQKPVNLAMAHMVGAGGVCVIHLFKK
jgi:acetyl-CoA acetyltransferase